MTRFNAGDCAYVVTNGRIVTKVRVVKPGYYSIVSFAGRSGGIRVRENRLFTTEDEARATIKQVPKYKQSHITPWDF